MSPDSGVRQHRRRASAARAGARAPQPVADLPLLERWLSVVLVPANPGPRQRLPRHVLALVVASAYACAASIAMGTGVTSAGSAPALRASVNLALGIVAGIGTVGGLAWMVLVLALGRRWLSLIATAVSALVAALVAGGVDAATGAGGTRLVLVAATFAAGFSGGNEVSSSSQRHWWWVVCIAVVATALRDGSSSLVVANAAAFGVVTGCAVSLIVGARPRGVDAATVRRELTRFGIEVDQLAEEKRPGIWGLTAFRAETPAGEHLDVQVFSRQARDGLLLSRIWRLIWYRDAESPLQVSPSSQVERQVAAILSASAAGVSVPEVVFLDRVEPTLEAFLVLREIDGCPLTDLKEPPSGEVLAAAWQALARLASARIAHRALHGSNVVVESDGTVGFARFGRSQLMATDQELEIDRAALLFATAEAVEPTEAVEVAARALGNDRLAASVPLLQPAALGTSSLLGRRERQQMEALRREAALAAGIENAEPAPIQRVNFGTLAMAAGAALGIWLLAAQLTGLSDLRGTIANAQWGWVALALVISQVAVVANAFAMTGSVAATIPLGPLVLVRMGYTFIGLVAGSAGVAATLIRFYQKRGIPAVAAVSAGVFFGIAGFSCQVVLTTIGLIAAGDEFSFAHHGRGTGSTLLNVLLICVIAAGIVAIALTALPRFRRSLLGKVKPQADLALSNLRAITSQPGKLARLFSGEAANQLLLAVTLGASVRAFGGSVSFGALLVVNSLVCVIGGMAPIPGGMGVMEAGYIAGLEGAGASQAVAVAATLTFRLATTYLPPIWGWFAFNALRRRDEL